MKLHKTLAITLTLSLAPIVLSSFQRVNAAENIVLGRDGKSSYCIYYSPTATRSVQEAAKEFKSYLQKSAKLDLPIVVGPDAPKQPFISLGDNAAAQQAGFKVAAIGPEGFRIAVKDGNLFILGPDTPDDKVFRKRGVSYGTANGVYTFLEDYLGIAWLMPGDLGEQIPTKTAIEIPSNVDRTEVPQFVYRRLPYIQLEKSAVAKWELRQKLGQSIQISHGHEWDRAIPAENFKQHPDWFAEINGQRIPPTGRFKIETTNPAVVRAYADKAIAEFEKDPTLDTYSLSPTDGGGWSQSAESRALYDTDPRGRQSVTPLVMKFYADVARIVAKKRPDKKLGGYIYADYWFPPSKGDVSLPSNLFPTITSNGYGFTLYRPDIRQEWDEVMGYWSKKTDNLIYYDLPNSLKQSTGIILPPAPDILNFIFSRLTKNKIKGVYIYGLPDWGPAGVTNYVMAKLLWNPDQDARELCRQYYRLAYGEAAAVPMEQLYDTVDTAYRDYYLKDATASYNMTPSMLREIYAPIYPRLESLFLEARDKATDAKAKARLALFQQTVELLQWNLRANGLLKEDKQSPLYRTDEQIDSLFTTHNAAFDFASDVSDRLYLPGKWHVEKVAEPLSNAAPVKTLQLKTDSQIMLQPIGDGPIEVTCEKIDTMAEIPRYLVIDEAGKRLATGVVRAGRTIRIPAEAGHNYFLGISSTWSTYQLGIKNAAYALKADPQSRGLRIDSYATPLYFNVPEGVDSFDVTFNGPDIIATLTAPDGTEAAKADTTKTPTSRVTGKAGGKSGLWRVDFEAAPNTKIGNLYVVLDPSLPQWFTADPQLSLKVTSAS